MAMYGTNKVASSGREEGVKLFKLVSVGSSEDELQYIGDVLSLKQPLPGVTPIPVTCPKFHLFGHLLIGEEDGFLRMVTFADDFALNGDSNTDGDDMMQAPLLSSPQQHCNSLYRMFYRCIFWKNWIW